jgi:hypothetical protein
MMAIDFLLFAHCKVKGAAELPFVPALPPEDHQRRVDVEAAKSVSGEISRRMNSS